MEIPPLHSSRNGPCLIRSACRALVMTFFGAISCASGQTPAAKIMPLGDSITRGSNDINYPNGDIPGGYRKNLGNLLTTANLTYDFVGNRNDNAAAGMDPDHNGNNGFRTDQIITDLPGMLAVQPDTVLLHAGTNDILQSVPVATAVANLGNLLDTLIASGPRRRIYVATIIPITQAWNGHSAAELNGNVVTYNTQVRNLVQQHADLGHHVTLVDMNASLVYTDPDPAKNFFQPGDGLHPGQAGYNRMADVWFNSITATGSLLDDPVSGVPSRPTSLAASVVSGSRINLSWTDNSGNENGFRIYRKIGSLGAWVMIGTAPANGTSYAATGLVTGLNNYHFAVSSTSAAGDSDWSNVVSCIYNNKALYKPASASTIFNTSFGAANAVSGNLSLMWSAASSDTAARWTVDLGAAYQIQQLKLVTRQDVDQPNTRKNFEFRASNDSSFATYSVLASQGSTPLPHASTLTVNISNPAGFRYVRVAKTDTLNFVINEVEVYGAVSTTIPAAPDNLTVTSALPTRAELSWQIHSANESAFKLERKIGINGTFVEIANLAAASTSFADNALTPQTTYFYRLRATNEVGNSAYSNMAGIATPAMSAYDNWAVNYPSFLALPTAHQLPSGDPNGDGISNLLAYGLGLNPLASLQPGSLPVLAPGMVFQFRRNNLATDLIHEVLVSPDLSPDSWTVRSQAGATINDISGNGTIVQVAVPIPLDPGGTRKFARLRVTRQPTPPEVTD